MLNKLVLIVIGIIFLGVMIYLAILLTSSSKTGSVDLDKNTSQDISKNSTPANHVEGLENSEKETNVGARMLLLRTTFNKTIASEDYYNLAKEYAKGLAKKFNLDLMDTSVPKIGKIASLGITMLSAYAKKKDSAYRRIAEYLINRLDVELRKLVDDNKQAPWNQNWYDVGVLLPRMLAMYEFLGTKDKLKVICSRWIREITPELNVSLGKKRTGIELVWIAVPRIVTNFIYDANFQSSQLKSPAFQAVKDAMTVASIAESATLTDGLHKDGSYIYNKVATYWPLIESREFYSNVFWALMITIDNDVIEEILTDVLHPELDFVPMGLFGRQPQLTWQQTVTPSLPKFSTLAANSKKVQIWPVSGLGVLKTERFAFWLRVQRNGIAAYESDHDNFEYAAGWIQMRKLYLVAQNGEYLKTLTRANLKNQPGVIYYADEQDSDFESFKLAKEDFVKTHSATILESHIGNLDETPRVLYWWNKYKFDFYGSETVINEHGVCTSNGLVVRLKVNNKSGRTLTVRTKDEHLGDTNFKCTVGGVDNTEGIVTVNNNEEPLINWRQEFDKTDPQKMVTWVESEEMAFKINNVKYEIKPQQQDHFVLKDTKLLVGGSSKTNFLVPISYINGENPPVECKFDDKSMMYKP